MLKSLQQMQFYTVAVLYRFSLRLQQMEGSENKGCKEKQFVAFIEIIDFINKIILTNMILD